MALLMKPLLMNSRPFYFSRHFSTTRICFLPKPATNSIANSKVQKEIPLGERVKENVKTTSYLGVVLLGAGVTGFMFYTILNELFSNQSPSVIYAEAFEKCKNDFKVQDSLGNPIKAFGEETRRGRRNQIAHQIYEKNNRKFMRLSFHIQGIRNKATVQCEVREGDSGKYEYRYLFVQLDNYPHTTIILEDNRINDTSSTSS